MNSSEFLLLCLQDASIDPSEVFNRVVSSVCILLTRDEVILCFFKFFFLYLLQGDASSLIYLSEFEFPTATASCYVHVILAACSYPAWLLGSYM